LSKLGVRISLTWPAWSDIAAETCLTAGSEVSFSAEDSRSETGGVSTMSPRVDCAAISKLW